MNSSKRMEHISDKAKEKVKIKPTNCIDLSEITPHNRDALILALDHCIKCNTCKYAFQTFTPSCPSGEEFKWESYWASGRIRIARALLTKKLEFSEDILHPIYTCITCGSCQDQCQAVHHERIVDIIEALRELTVKQIGVPEKQKKLELLIQEFCNPYGEKNSDNESLKKKHNLPEKANIVYFIGCTSNYRQQDLRDATISVFKKLGITFTLIDEYCCGSPLIRTGQIDEISRLITHNIEELKRVGATTVVTSCAGCYRTLKKDFEKFSEKWDVNVLHTTEFLNPRITPGMVKKIDEMIVTYHDPCHLGHHLGYFEIPRDLLNKIPIIKLREMERNRKTSWCCGAGGGIKIGYPDLALKTSNIRVEEAISTGAKYLVSTCPFCKTNLTDAKEINDKKIEVIDLIEILDRIL